MKKRYVALLRGINVGGNNKVSMSDLRECFESEGFSDVSTYINSGNVLFTADEIDTVKLVRICENAIEKRCGFSVVTMVIAANDLVTAVRNAPPWWAAGEPTEFRNDALFIIPPTDPSEVLAELSKKPSPYDKLAVGNHVVFWTLPKAHYNKSVVPKIIGTPIYSRITMRSSTTTKKLVQLIESE